MRRRSLLGLLSYALLVSFGIVFLFVGAVNLSFTVINYARVAAAQDPQVTLVHHAIVPARIIVPSLGIDARVNPEPTGQSGTMMTPKSLSRVGWFSEGPEPGEAGNAIFAGHLDNGLGLPGVFSHLHSIKKGDKIYVTDADKSGLLFEVTNTAIYSADVPLESVIEHASGEGIALITCEGVWVPAEKSYSGRLVVFAKEVH